MTTPRPTCCITSPACPGSPSRTLPLCTHMWACVVLGEHMPRALSHCFWGAAVAGDVWCVCLMMCARGGDAQVRKHASSTCALEQAPRLRHPHTGMVTCILHTHTHTHTHARPILNSSFTLALFTLTPFETETLHTTHTHTHTHVFLLCLASPDMPAHLPCSHTPLALFFFPLISFSCA